MDNLISVIIPVYNVEKYLSRCVDSVLQQTCQNFEIILVDDGTPDHSGEICDAYAAKDARIRVIHKENGGLSSARNAGIEAARGKWLQFTDSDDYISSDMLQSLLDACLQDGTRMAMGGNTDVYEDRKVRGLCPEKHEVLTAQQCNARLMVQDGGDFSACDKLFDARLFEGIRFPLGKTCEDMAIMYRIVHRAGMVSFVPKPMCHYCHREDSITTMQFSEKNFSNIEFSEEIFHWVQKTCPEILPSANVMYVRALMYTMIWITRGKPEFRSSHREQYAHYRRELQRLLGFTLRSDFFTGKQKFNAVMLVWKLFPITDRLHNRNQYAQ